jgi:CxxC-x17-CxxC domain-containing protein
MEQYQDKDIDCVECGAVFVFSASEQEMFAQRGYLNEPKRCPTCREARRARRSYGDRRSDRQMHSVACAECGKDTEVPFEPRQGRPVYCNECYAKIRDQQ